MIEPCFGIGHSLSLICQPTSEDIKHRFTSEDVKLHVTTTAAFRAVVNCVVTTVCAGISEAGVN